MAGLDAEAVSDSAKPETTEKKRKTRPNRVKEIELPDGNIDDAVLAKAETIVQQLNCRGYRPGGLALGLAKKFPYGNSYADREPEPFCGNECISEHRATPGTIDVRLPPEGSKGPRVN